LLKVSERIALDGDHVCELTRLKRADTILPADEFRRARRGGANGFRRREKPALQKN